MTMHGIEGVLETCLYASDLDAAERFYHGVLGLEVDSREAGRHVFFRCGAAMFLMFDPAHTIEQAPPGRRLLVPPHGAIGPGHVAFRVSQERIPEWRDRLRRAGVDIETEVEWPGGGRSLYVRDPAGNSVELASPTIWGL